MGRQLPRSVTWAIRTQVALVVVSGLITVLTAVLRDELVDAWARRSPALAAGGTEPPAFVPVAVVLFVTFALLAGVLLVFFRSGHPSARLSLTGLAVFFLFTMVVMVRQDPPGLFAVLASVTAVLDLALVYFLWHRDTSEFLRGAQLADELET
jgi:hypothetical protein